MIEKLFNIDEIRHSRLLQIMYWVLLFGFYLSFSSWIDQRQGICPPYFQNCEEFNFFLSSSSPYRKETIYFLLVTLMVGGAVAAWLQQWTLAVTVFIPLTLFKIFNVFFINFSLVAEYEYFHIPVVLAYVFCSRKSYFMRRTFVLMYIFSASMKFSETWIIGGYFTSLKNGLPWFSDGWVPFVTNGVILFEIFAPWFLLSANRRSRMTALILWSMFHLYSIYLVGFLYPSYCLPILLTLFLPDPQQEERNPEFSPKDFIGWGLLATLILISITPWFLPGNKLYSLQGRRLGVQMFDANHQVISEETLILQDGQEVRNTYSNPFAMRRESPYSRWMSFRRQCQSPNIVAIRWKYFSSANGGPFYTIVDSENACELDYSEWSHNTWIQSPEEGAPIAGYPRKNNLLGSPTLKSATQTLMHPTPDASMLHANQSFFIQNLRLLTNLYWFLWAVAFAYFTVQAWRRRI